MRTRLSTLCLVARRAAAQYRSGERAETRQGSARVIWTHRHAAKPHCHPPCRAHGASKWIAVIRDHLLPLGCRRRCVRVVNCSHSRATDLAGAVGDHLGLCRRRRQCAGAITPTACICCGGVAAQHCDVRRRRLGHQSAQPLMRFGVQLLAALRQAHPRWRYCTPISLSRAPSPGDVAPVTQQGRAAIDWLPATRSGLEMKDPICGEAASLECPSC